jgi:hypothetical protein
MPLATRNRQRTITRSDRRCHLDPRKACGSGRPSDSRPLGRRSAERIQEQLHCDTGRTPFTLRHADPGAEQRNGSCSRRLEPACSQTSRHVETLADVGPGTGDGETQGLYSRHRRAGLFLRSAKPLATRHGTKTPISSYGNTSHEAPICPTTLKSNSTRSRCS